MFFFLYVVLDLNLGHVFTSFCVESLCGLFAFKIVTHFQADSIMATQLTWFCEIHNFHVQIPNKIYKFLRTHAYDNHRVNTKGYCSMLLDTTLLISLSRAPVNLLDDSKRGMLKKGLTFSYQLVGMCLKKKFIWSSFLF